MKHSIINIILGLTALCGYSTTFAKEKGHRAHEHGMVQVQIASEGKKLSIVLESPAESFYGFEHEARTEGEKKAQNSALDVLKNKLSELIVLDASLQCTWSNVKLEVVKEEEDDHEDEKDHEGHQHKSHKEEHHGEHREVRGEWSADCKKSPSGSFAQFTFSKYFSRIGKIKVDVLSDQKQSHQELKKGDGKVQL